LTGLTRSGTPAGRILLPLDGSDVSERALQVASQVARALSYQVALLRVLETDSLPTTLNPDQQIQLDQLVAEARIRAEDYLNTLRDRLRQQGIETTADVLPGTPAEAIVFLAHSQGVDLIAMATHGRTGLDRWIMGSVTDKVLQLADCPVLAVRAREGGQAPLVNRIVVGLDGSPLAERSLPWVAALGKGLGVTVTLVRVVSMAGILMLASDPTGFPPLVTELLAGIEQDAQDYLARQQLHLREQGLEVETQVVRGDPAVSLVDAGDAGTLTVVTTHGQTGPGRFIMGSVSEKLVRGAAGPVLVVR
jgi:nucleotide-binding universal stress UspA family protein